MQPNSSSLPRPGGSRPTAIDARAALPRTPFCRADRIASPLPGKCLCVMGGAARAGASRTPSPIVYVHGATFPSSLAVGWRFDGVSWADDLVAAGLDVWAFDFLGYGGSDRYDEMRQPARAASALGRCALASHQLAKVVEHVLAATGAARVSLLAHSWGTQPAAAFAAAYPERVDRLVLFGPVLPRETAAGADSTDPDAVPAHGLVTLQAQWMRFTQDVPVGHPPVLLQRHFEPWGEAYLDTDPASRSRTPPAVQIPLGPAADVAATWHGRLPYDPAAVRAPTLLLRGAWDSVCDDRDAQWFERAFTGARSRRDVKLARGTHLMHLEESRGALWRASREFLGGNA